MRWHTRNFQAQRALMPTLAGVCRCVCVRAVCIVRVRRKSHCNAKAGMWARRAWTCAYTLAAGARRRMRGGARPRSSVFDHVGPERRAAAVAKAVARSGKLANNTRSHGSGIAQASRRTTARSLGGREGQRCYFMKKCATDQRVQGRHRRPHAVRRQSSIIRGPSNRRTLGQSLCHRGTRPRCQG